VLSLPGVKAVDLTMTSQVRATRSEQKDKLLPLVFDPEIPVNIWRSD